VEAARENGGRMQHVTFEGSVKVNEYFPCQMCGETSKFKYLKYPHPSVQHLYNGEDKLPLNICKKCAKREIGSKNKKGWDKLHEQK